MIDLESKSPDQSAMPDVTPLLDVVFILLIFFVISAAFALRGVDMELPQATASRQLAGKVLHIVLDRDGQIRFDGLPVTLQQLGPMLESTLRTETSPRQIVLKACPDASVGHFMRTIDTIRTHGGYQLVMATAPAGAETKTPSAGTGRSGLRHTAYPPPRHGAGND